jgi:hypothetical protein
MRRITAAIPFHGNEGRLDGLLEHIQRQLARAFD